MSFWKYNPNVKQNYIASPIPTTHSLYYAYKLSLEKKNWIALDHVTICSLFTYVARASLSYFYTYVSLSSLKSLASKAFPSSQNTHYPSLSH